MVCKVCGEKAQVEVRSRGFALCKAHYLDWFVKETEKAIRRHKMLSPGERVLVAVSGGKDSLALWDVLSRLGYQAVGLHIELGIGEYSRRSLEVTEAFARERGLPLLVVDLKEAYGFGVPELAQLSGRVACSACGLSKRYILNQVAVEGGFRAVATGHNLDDEAAVLFGNLLNPQEDALVRQGPVLPEKPGLAARVKPFYRFSEREVLSYTLLRGIRYLHEECPNAKGAKSLLYKEALNLVEKEMPGAKLRFLEGFLEKVQPRLQGEGEVALRECQRCGYPTTGAVCSFCRMWEAVYRKAKKRRLLPEEAVFHPHAEPTRAG
ncbi:ATP pyrophosphatase [Thermus sp. 2.9]|uniref:tRNA-5-methyluridine(54) 2-sulfurtransferase n=1 Tax=Thermus sp. (strain 2.9) TaxID=1577051 RepID=UPI000543CCBA|nr:ATP-binding protein [Thermus sp. 2.9]KHG65088.1 ATP pyrophosphatase [Thermus sp. 2.9]